MQSFFQKQARRRRRLSRRSTIAKVVGEEMSIGSSSTHVEDHRGRVRFPKSHQSLSEKPFTGGWRHIQEDLVHSFILDVRNVVFECLGLERQKWRWWLDLGWDSLKIEKMQFVVVATSTAATRKVGKDVHVEWWALCGDWGVDFNGVNIRQIQWESDLTNLNDVSISNIYETGFETERQDIGFRSYFQIQLFSYCFFFSSYYPIVCRIPLVALIHFLSVMQGH